MKTKSKIYSEVYFIDSPEYLTNKQWDNLLVAGKKNWNHYFLPFKTKQGYEVIENVELVKFNTEDDMFEYIKNLNPASFLNFSLEHKSPCVLKLI